MREAFPGCRITQGLITLAKLRGSSSEEREEVKRVVDQVVTEHHAAD